MQRKFLIRKKNIEVVILVKNILSSYQYSYKKFVSMVGADSAPLIHREREIEVLMEKEHG